MNATQIMLYNCTTTKSLSGPIVFFLSIISRFCTVFVLVFVQFFVFSVYHSYYVHIATLFFSVPFVYRARVCLLLSQFLCFVDKIPRVTDAMLFMKEIKATQTSIAFHVYKLIQTNKLQR